MAEKKSGPQDAVKGAVEGIKGRVKETLGTAAGRDDLTREGRIQQDKAEAERDAAKKEAEAAKARGDAAVEEERLQADQDDQDDKADKDDRDDS
jgi:uncharacterized protein YjbJ (UPF0337 family)